MMVDQKGRSQIPYQYGVPLESSMARRERLANKYDIDFGQHRIFPELVEALLDEIPDDCSLLEVGAATGLLTRPLIDKAASVTALEPSAGLLKRLLHSDVAESPRLRIKQGMVEDLLHDEMYDVAVVTFTPRRGQGLSRLLVELAVLVRESVVMLLDDDGSLDWAYLARSAAVQGFDVRLRIVVDKDSEEGEQKRAVVLAIGIGDWEPSLEPVGDWASDSRDIEVPYPPPRGTATRLVRYFLAGGDRAILINTDPKGVERLYGNLRTAVHRLGREEVTIRRQDDSIQIVRLPKTTNEDE